MKFLPLASLTMAAAASDNSSIRRHLGRMPRKLDGAQQFDGSTTSIKFSKCVDIKTLPDDYETDDDGVLKDLKYGDMVSAKSYVLFHMCSGDTCDEDEEYIVDISTYTKYIASYHANYEGTICQACNKYANFCSSGNDDGGNSYNNNYNNNYRNNYNNNNNNNYRNNYNNNNRYNNNYNNYGGRNLKKFDCDECEQYNCFSQNYNNGYNEAINNLIDDISDCLRTGSYGSNGEELYAGPMCSASGKGVEIALFLDNQCTTYTTQKKFESLPSYYMYSSDYVFEATQDSFKKAFSQTTSCEDLDIGNPYNQANDDGAYNNGYGEMNDYCKQIFDEGGALTLSSCSANDDQYGKYAYGNQNQYNGNYNGNNGDDDFLKWYTYDMTVDNAQDINLVCSTVSEMGGSYSNYYNKYKSGTWYTASISSGYTGEVIEELQESSTAIAVGALSFFLIGAVVGGVWLYKKQQERLINICRGPLYNDTFEDSIRTEPNDSIRTEGVMT